MNKGVIWTIVIAVVVLIIVVMVYRSKLKAAQTLKENSTTTVTTTGTDGEPLTDTSLPVVDEGGSAARMRINRSN